METSWKKAREGGSSPINKLRALIAAQLRLIQATPAIPAILFSRELHTKNKELRVAFLALMGRFRGLIADLIIHAQDAGEIRGDIDPDDAALLIVGLVQGLALRWSLSGREFSLTEEGQRLLELQLSGFARAATTKTKERTS